MAVALQLAMCRRRTCVAAKLLFIVDRKSVQVAGTELHMQMDKQAGCQSDCWDSISAASRSYKSLQGHWCKLQCVAWCEVGQIRMHMQHCMIC